MPPVEVPNAVRPMAKARRLWKYVATMARVGQKRHPFPRPTHTPWAIKTCQYWVHADAVRVPRTTSTAPTVETERKKPASVRRPMKVPMKKRRNTQEMSDGVRPRKST